MSTRTNTHIIDTRTIKNVLGILPDHWVIRELSERDYGIDLQVEIFKKVAAQKYSNTGCLLNIQVKGTNKDKPKKVKHAFSKKQLEYFNNFPIPVIIFKVFNQIKDNNHTADIFYVWAQKYIEHELDVKKKDWRTEVQFYKKGKNKGEVKESSFKIKFPKKNILRNEDSFQRLEEFAFRPRFIVELKEFVEAYTCLKSYVEDYPNGYGGNPKDLKFLQSWLRRARYFSALLTQNDCQVDSDTIFNLENFLVDFKFGDSDSNDFESIEGKEDLDRMSLISGNYFTDVERSMSEVSGKKPY